MKKTLVLGASANPYRYSYKAVKLLKKYGYPVIALGNKNGFIDQVPIITEKKFFDDIHTITIYLRPQIQSQYYDYILSLKPQRVIFNPGTENPEFREKLKQQGIEVVENCTLVMLHSGLF